MAANTKNNIIQFRVTDEEYALLQNEARSRGLSEGKTARIVLLDGLSGFDRKQEHFLRRLDKIDETLELIIHISSLGAAAAALPLDAEQQDMAVLRQKLKTHFQHSSDLGKNIVEMIQKGKL